MRLGGDGIQTSALAYGGENHLRLQQKQNHGMELLGLKLMI